MSSWKRLRQKQFLRSGPQFIEPPEPPVSTVSVRTLHKPIRLCIRQVKPIRDTREITANDDSEYSSVDETSSEDVLVGRPQCNLQDETIVDEVRRVGCRQVSHTQLLLHLGVGRVAVLAEVLAAGDRDQTALVVDDRQLELDGPSVVEDQVRVENHAAVLAGRREPLRIDFQFPLPRLWRNG